MSESFTELKERDLGKWSLKPHLIFIPISHLGSREMSI